LWDNILGNSSNDEESAVPTSHLESKLKGADNLTTVFEKLFKRLVEQLECCIQETDEYEDYTEMITVGSRILKKLISSLGYVDKIVQSDELSDKLKELVI